MAKGKKTGGRDFKPGSSGNPSGRPKTPDDLKAIRNTSSFEIGKIMYDLTFAKESDLQTLLKNREATVIEKILAKGLLESMRAGDFKRLHYFLERLIGRPAPSPLEQVSQESFHLQAVKFIEQQRLNREGSQNEEFEPIC